MSEEVEGEGARREEGEKREGERREGDSQEGERQHEGPEGADELDELTRALQGFEPCSPDPSVGLQLADLCLLFVVPGLLVDSAFNSVIVILQMTWCSF